MTSTRDGESHSVSYRLYVKPSDYLNYRVILYRYCLTRVAAAAGGVYGVVLTTSARRGADDSNFPRAVADDDLELRR